MNLYDKINRIKEIYYDKLPEAKEEYERAYQTAVSITANYANDGTDTPKSYNSKELAFQESAHWKVECEKLSQELIHLKNQIRNELEVIEDCTKRRIAKMRFVDFKNPIEIASKVNCEVGTVRNYLTVASKIIKSIT